MNLRLVAIGYWVLCMSTLEAWEVKVVNKSDATYQVVGCFSESTVTPCDIGTDIVTIAPRSTGVIPLPAGPGSCLNHLYYRKI